MAKVIYTDKDFKIIKTNRDYVLKNVKGKYENHGHFKKEKTCYLVIRLINRGIVPYSKYLRGSVLRISLDKDYKAKVKAKIKKDKQKQYYININKGKR